MRSNIGICLSHFMLKLYIGFFISENTLVKKSYFFTKPKLVTTNSVCLVEDHIVFTSLCCHK